VAAPGASTVEEGLRRGPQARHPVRAPRPREGSVASTPARRTLNLVAG